MQEFIESRVQIIKNLPRVSPEMLLDYYAQTVALKTMQEALGGKVIPANRDYEQSLRLTEHAVHEELLRRMKK